VMVVESTNQALLPNWKVCFSRRSKRHASLRNADVDFHFVRMIEPWFELGVKVETVVLVPSHYFVLPS
jgi:hypothetical protein